MRKLFVVLFALSLLPAASCFGHGSFVYVTNYGDGTISQYRANPNGILTPLNPPTVRAHILCHGLAVAQGRFLYAISAHDWTKRDCVISQFQIARDGTLKPLSPAQVLLPGTPATIAVEPTGKFVYVFNREGTTTQLRIGTDGRLAPLSQSVIKVANAGGITPIVSFDKRHHILYGSYVVGMMDTVLGGTFALMMEQNGQLKPLPKSGTFYNTVEQKVSPPNSISLTPSGRYAYVTESLHDMSVAQQWRDVVAQYRSGPDGVLKPLSPGTVPIETAGASYIEPNGHSLYLLYEKADADGVTAHYRLAYAPIGLNGRLGKFAYQTLGKGPQPAVQPFSLAFDYTGRFCYFVEGNYLYAFRLRVNGSLAPLHPSRIYAGYGPLGVVCVQR